MFGYYTIESNGQRCYCNVTLWRMPYFDYDGNTYVSTCKRYEPTRSRPSLPA